MLHRGFVFALFQFSWRLGGGRADRTTTISGRFAHGASGDISSVLNGLSTCFGFAEFRKGQTEQFSIATMPLSALSVQYGMQLMSLGFSPTSRRELSLNNLYLFSIHLLNSDCRSRFLVLSRLRK